MVYECDSIVRPACLYKYGLRLVYRTYLRFIDFNHIFSVLNYWQCYITIAVYGSCG